MSGTRFGKRGRLPAAAALLASAALPATAGAQQGTGAVPGMPGMDHSGMGGGMAGMDHSGMGNPAAAPSAAWALGMGRDPAPSEAVARLEVDFLAGMIPHHRDAISMAAMVPEKSPREELRDLARKIIKDQAEEIEKMSFFLRDWYGTEPPAAPMMTMGMMQMMDMPMMHGTIPNMAARMEALRAKTGADFDVEFMSAMTDHHAMAVMMAAPVLISGHHAELHRLATQIVVAQGGEIRQMDEWLDAWYRVARPV